MIWLVHIVKMSFLSEKPNTFYLGGMLYPANVEVEDIEVREQQPVPEDEEKVIHKSEKDYDDPDTEDEVTNTNRFQPSSIGLTCNIRPDTKTIKIVVEYGKYKEVKEEKKKRYQRSPISEPVTISLGSKTTNCLF